MQPRSNVIAIFGPPGSGKTTVAKALCEEYGWEYVSSGDIARKVDPGALVAGRMADRALLQAGFLDALEEAQDRGAVVVVDGLPRDPTDVSLLPPDTEYVLLNVRDDIAIERQLRRARPGDTPSNIGYRTIEQRKLMELDRKDGWAFQLAGWRRSLATGDKTIGRVYDAVRTYLVGERPMVG